MQSILDTFLSFLKLSTYKILIGVLMLTSGGLSYELIREKKSHEKELAAIKIEYKKETDGYRETIIKSAIESSKRETQMMKDCYDEKENILRKIDNKIKDNKQI